MRRALRRHLERLEGVQWATVNDVVGRVLVGIDDRRVSVEEVVGAVTAIERARGAGQVFPQRLDHPGDLEPLLAAGVTAAVDTAAVGAAFLGKVLPIPALTRHATLTIALLDSQQWLKDGLEARIGPIGTGLVFSGTSAFLHALTQSPTVPAINAVAALQQALEIRARRQVWRRREPELCRPEPACVLLAGPQRGFTDAVRRMVLVRGAATTVGATGAWATGRLTGSFGRASTMGLAALLSTQLGQTAWSGRRSPLVLATAAGSAAVLFVLVQTPGLSRFFGCTPLDPLSWLVALGWAAAGTVTAEVAPALVDRLVHRPSPRRPRRCTRAGLRLRR